MFQNYDITPNNYIPNNMCDRITPPSPVQPLVAYNAAGEAIGFTWHYGDVITLTFTTNIEIIREEDNFYEDASTYLQGKQMRLFIYDFRYEIIYDETKDAAEELSFIIDSGISPLFVEGAYRFQLVLIDEKNKTQQTLLGGDDCIFYVK